MIAHLAMINPEDISPGFALANTELAAVCNRIHTNQQARPNEILDALLNCAASLMHTGGMSAKRMVDGSAYKIGIFASQYGEERSP